MAKRNTEERRVSHIEFVSAGLLNDVDVEFTNCRFMRWQYPNGDLKITVFAIDAKTEDGEEHELTWSVGGDDDFMPSKDGMYLVAAEDSERSSLAKNSKYQAFMDSLKGCGLDDDHLEEFGTSADHLDGTSAHIMRVPFKGFSGAGRSTGGGSRRRQAEDGEKRENEVVVVSDIHSFPWDKKGAKKGAASKGTGSGSGSKSKASKATEKAEESDAGDDDNEFIAVKAIKKVLLKAGDAMPIDDMILEVYQEGLPEDMDRKTRKLIMNEYLNDRKWLAKLDGVAVDGDSIELE